MNKTIAKHIVLLLVLASFSVPLVKWYLSPELTHFEIFANSWLFIVYGVVIYLFGYTTVKTMFEDE